jgi:polyribonucleotide nucleotidyltransferase
VLSEGQEVKVKVLGVDDRGKVRLSMRLVNQETGEELPDTRPPREERPRGERGDRDRGGRDRDRGRGGRDRDRGPRRDRGDGERGERRPRDDADGGDAGLPEFIAGDRD